MAGEDQGDRADTLLLEEVPAVPADRTPDDRPASRLSFGRYAVEEKIAEGGMGVVYRARDRMLDEVVAIKVVRRAVLGKKHVLERFKREVKLARRVTHPNVARIYELGEEDGVLYLTMEYVEGSSLAQLLAKERPMELHSVARHAAAICSGLGAAHQAGVIHRDIKPGNVLVSKSGRTVLTDFGLAREVVQPAESVLTQGLAGTPAYMAPEQVEGAPISVATDVYALATMLFEMCTGHLPFSRKTPYATALARVAETPPDPREFVPSLPEPIAELLLEALSRDPEKRPSLMVIATTFASLYGQAASMEPSPRTSVFESVDLRMAVLPLRDASGGDKETVADLLTDQLITSFSRLWGLRVLAEARNEGSATGALSPVEAGRRLEVDFVLEGTAMSTPRGHRLSIQLWEVSSGRRAWSAELELGVESLLGGTDRVVQAAAPVIGLEPVPAPTFDLARPEALDLYLEARDAYHRFDVERAVDCFERAALLAPDHPMISAGLVTARMRQLFMAEQPEEDALEVARREAEHAVEVGDRFGPAHMALALVHLHSGAYGPATRELKTAISCSPSLADAHGMLGQLLLECGRRTDGRRRLEAALALDPRQTASRAALALVRAYKGDLEGGLRMLRIDRPGVGRLAAPEARLSTWQPGTSHLETLDAEISTLPPGPDRAFATAILSAHVGRCSKEEAYDLFVDRMEKKGASVRHRVLSAQLLAELACRREDPKTAVRAVVRAGELGLLDLTWLDHCPLLERIRDTREVDAVREKAILRADEVYEAVWG